MIASESLCPPAVLAALGSPFNNIYAEGYPSTRMTLYEDGRLDEVDYMTVSHRRYADRRYYKGVDYANFVEALAMRRLREIFATETHPPERIYANVQPLSGAAANNAVYNAFLKPGDVVMGMNLRFGGHLTHGSPSNRSGVFFEAVSYEADRASGRMDYDRIRDIAKKHRPRMIIAGFSAYPWAPDWKKFREIADEVDAILLADIAHTAGLVVGGVHPSPVGLAHVISFTTHKTLCGVRGACILSTEPEIAERIDAAVFPGEQGGPHVHQMAAKAVSFALAGRPEFRDLMRAVVDNAKALADAFRERGLTLAYGGTDTHMVMVDLTRIKTPNGQALTGEIASRIMEFAHIVVNKNTIPGDENPAHPGAIRFGTTWASQRGLGPDEMKRVAGWAERILTNIHPYFYSEAKGAVGRGKIDAALVDSVRGEVAELLRDFVTDPDVKPSHDYPHFFGRGTAEATRPLEESHRRRGAVVEDGAVVSYGDPAAEAAALLDGPGVLVDASAQATLLVRGRRAANLLDNVLTCDVHGMPRFSARRGLMLDTDGRLLDEIAVVRLDRADTGDDEFLLVGCSRDAETIKYRLRMLADGYAFGDPQDIFLKVEGPALVYDVTEAEPPRTVIRLAGAGVADAPATIEADLGGLETGQARRARDSNIVAAHLPFGEGRSEALLLVPVGLAEEVWSALEKKGPVACGLDGYEAARKEAGLPVPGDADEYAAEELLERFRSHFAPEKPFFVGRRALSVAAVETDRKRFEWTGPEDAPLKRTALYEEHRSRTRFLVPFAGWEMPVWYTRVTEEHAAVRESCGLFDVSHMGLFEFRGADATRFLDMLLSNYVYWFHPRQAFYAYMLDADGVCVDDTFLYKFADDHYWMVVNAANTDKDRDWILGVLEGRRLTDAESPECGFAGEVEFRDLKDPALGDARWVNVALQGPNALTILSPLADGDDDRAALASLRRSEFTWVSLRGVRTMAARTGYTGERTAFEIYVPWAEAPRVWNLLIEAGEPHGLALCGLGARDSTRTEAGLPLYGQELAGPFDVTPIEAGYGAFVKFHKPYFIGRRPLLERDAKRAREIVRFVVARRGARTLHTGDPVVAARRNRHVGFVTSCALMPNGRQVGLAIVERAFNAPETPLAVYPLPRRKKEEMRTPDEWRTGDFAVVPVEAEVMERFPPAPLPLAAAEGE